MVKMLMGEGEADVLSQPVEEEEEGGREWRRGGRSRKGGEREGRRGGGEGEGRRDPNNMVRRGESC